MNTSVALIPLHYKNVGIFLGHTAYVGEGDAYVKLGVYFTETNELAVRENVNGTDIVDYLVRSGFYSETTGAITLTKKFVDRFEALEFWRTQMDTPAAYVNAVQFGAVAYLQQYGGEKASAVLVELQERREAAAAQKLGVWARFIDTLEGLDE